MRIVFFIFGFFFVQIGLFGQSDSLNMRILNMEKNADSITIDVELNNMSNNKMLVYIPRLKDICSSLMHIKFQNVSSNDIHEVMPCNYNANIDCLEVNMSNSISIGAGSNYITYYTFKLRDISPFLKNCQTYNVFINWAFKDEYVKTTLDNVFKGDIESNKYLFKKR